MRWYLVFIALLFTGFVACKKESSKSKVPKITFQSLVPNTVKSGSSRDTIGISFKFEDGDADLGNDRGSANFDIFLTDIRDTTQVFKYFLPEIPEQMKDPSKGLEGSATVVLQAAFLVLDSLHKNGDTLHYELYIKDKAGNESNRLITPDIYVKPN